MEFVNPTLTERRRREFANGVVHLLETADGYPVEVTDTFLPAYTRDAAQARDNLLRDGQLGDRTQRWMVGVSVMSGCPVRCRFCATGRMKRWRRLTGPEILAQVDYVLAQHPHLDPRASEEFKINFTRMGEPFLNVDAVQAAVGAARVRWPGVHCYVSTIGVRGSDFAWVRGDVTLQVSLHALSDQRRRELIPFNRLMTLAELGEVRTASRLKTTLNLTLTDAADFDIGTLRRHFDPAAFFIKLSPLNDNPVAQEHNLAGVIPQRNLK